MLTDEEQVPDWVTLKSRRNRVVIVKQNKRFYSYDSKLQSLFVNDLIWDCLLYTSRCV